MDEKIVELLTGVQNAVTSMAPEAWRALVFTARVDSILTLAFCLFVIVVSYQAFKAWPPIWKWASDKELEPVPVLGGLLVVVLDVIAIICLFGTSTWLGLFYPEAVVITHLLDKIK